MINDNDHLVSLLFCSIFQHSFHYLNIDLTKAFTNSSEIEIDVRTRGAIKFIEGAFGNCQSKKIVKCYPKKIHCNSEAQKQGKFVTKSFAKSILRLNGN